nr:hypothetical protein [Tanacetum cinerariifolium]
MPRSVRTSLLAYDPEVEISSRLRRKAVRQFSTNLDFAGLKELFTEMSDDDATAAESPPRGVDSYYKPGNFEDPLPIVYPAAANGPVSNFKIQPNLIAILPVFRGSIHSWSEMKTAFLDEFYSISKTAAIRNKIKSLRQIPGEQFHDAFSRLKEFLRTCPHHDIPKWELVKFLYDGLDYHNHPFVMATSGGKKDDNMKFDSDLVNDLLKYFPKPLTHNPKATESPKVREGGVSSITTPYPEALEKLASARLAKKGPHFEDMWETFKQDLCTQKRKLKETLSKKIDLTECVSAVLSSSILLKLKDPGAPLISVVVGNITIKKALLDLGASINILPASLVGKYD